MIKCGIARCESSKFEKIDKKDFIKFKKHKYEYDALVEDRKTLISFILIFSATSIFQCVSGAGKALFGLLPVMITIVLTMFFTEGLYFYENFWGLFCNTLGGILGISIVEAIQIPCIYKFGAERARMQIFMIMIVLFLVLGLLVGEVFYWTDRLLIDLYMILRVMPFVFALLIVFVYHRSYKIAYRIYEKKEF